MELKAGYKQTDVGIIPEHWEVKALINCCDYADYRGKTPPKTSSGTFLITARNVRKGFIDYDESKEYVATDQYDIIMRCGQPRVGDVLITTEAPLGNVAQIDRDDVALAQRIIKYRPKNGDLCSTYLKFYLLSDRFQEILNSRASGSTAKGIKGRELHELPVVIPPVEEQLTIVGVLSDVDAMIHSLDQLIAKKRDLKDAAMKQLLSGRIRLPGFDAAWELKRLGNVAPLQRGFDLPGVQLKPGPCPVVYSNGILNYHNTSMAKGPGVVTGRSGTIGRVTYVDQDYWPHNTSLWVTSFEGNYPKFIYYLYSHIGFDRFGTGSGVPTLNRNDVHSFKVFLPTSPEEQHAISRVLSDMDAEIATLERRRDKTRALKQGMMQALLTGRTRLV